MTSLSLSLSLSTPTHCFASYNKQRYALRSPQCHHTRISHHKLQHSSSFLGYNPLRYVNCHLFEWFNMRNSFQVLVYFPSLIVLFNYLSFTEFQLIWVEGWWGRDVEELFVMLQLLLLQIYSGSVLSPLCKFPLLHYYAYWTCCQVCCKIGASNVLISFSFNFDQANYFQ